MDIKKEQLMQSYMIGQHNAKIDGRIVYDIPTKITFVSSEEDLALITEANPGDFAATFGMANVWQLGADGSTWVTVIEEE